MIATATAPVRYSCTDEQCPGWTVIIAFLLHLYPPVREVIVHLRSIFLPRTCGYLRGATFGAQGRTALEEPGGPEQLHFLLPSTRSSHRDGSAASACLVVIMWSLRAAVPILRENFVYTSVTFSYLQARQALLSLCRWPSVTSAPLVERGRPTSTRAVRGRPTSTRAVHGALAIPALIASAVCILVRRAGTAIGRMGPCSQCKQKCHRPLEKHMIRPKVRLIQYLFTGGLILNLLCTYHE
jgi:hypothetical protein